MKSPLIHTSSFFSAVLLLAAALPSHAQSSRSRWSRHAPSGSADSRHYDSSRYDTEVRRRYFANPRTSFTITFGNGYAGRGYYYGPPSAAYYYERPGVVFYRSWERVPSSYRRYLYAPRHGNAVAVQQALARLGYYRGPIDGDIGPGTRSAIVRFERRNGLRETGMVTAPLLRALNLN